MKQTEQKLGGEERSRMKFHEALADLERHLHAKANQFDRKRRSMNNYTHWKARGSQEALRQAAANLQTMRATYRSSRALHTALSGYLHCLEKSCFDAREESIQPTSKRSIPVVKWKAEGEYDVLLDMCAAIRKLCVREKDPSPAGAKAEHGRGATP